ncbi:site-specific integrase [Polaribacter pectinis]|uniref:Site-specific integrase n=1 Tax=Polaribacter pectinis TaxID=2738844 RepID=A0A7G9L7K5_9FLAO|nr:site-specific integrase [Polaribacter pectinis]QNM84604.1 site-specific integrase [Polaribacter pectinis]
MQSIYEYLTFTTKIEHDLEHDSKKSQLFSIPKIYIANGDLKKRWYVRFSFRNPETGKMTRMANIYGKVNNYKTKEARLAILTSYRKNLLKLLKLGFNPFEENSDLYHKLVNEEAQTKPKVESKDDSEKEDLNSVINQAVKNAIKDALADNVIVPKVNTEENNEKVFKDENTSSKKLNNEEHVKTKQYVQVRADDNGTVENTSEIVKNTAKSQHEDYVHESHVNERNEFLEIISIAKAFDLALELKSKEVSERTIRDYKSKSNRFVVWMQETYPEKKSIKDVTRKDLMAYLNDIALKTSARNRNNYRTELGSLFQVLKNNEVIEENYIPSIPVMKSKPERHKTYTLKVQESIFEYLIKEDPNLLLFIKFVAYNFIRPIEVCRLRIKDINLDTKTVQFKAKNSPLKTKIIPSILFDELPDLSKLDKESFLFTPNKIGAFWDANETNRRDHFSKRFRRVVKDHFKLNEDYGIYSFRHTFISKLYRKLREDSAPFEAKSNLMLITGHSSMSALEKYLREIDAELPEDYSNLFK